MIVVVTTESFIHRWVLPTCPLGMGGRKLAKWRQVRLWEAGESWAESTGSADLSPLLTVGSSGQILRTPGPLSQVHSQHLFLSCPDSRLSFFAFCLVFFSIFFLFLEGGGLFSFYFIYVGLLMSYFWFLLCRKGQIIKDIETFYWIGTFRVFCLMLSFQHLPRAPGQVSTAPFSCPAKT